MKDKMKICFVLLLTFFSISNAQENEKENIIVGKISFISSQNIYVKFDNTNGITEGDTLYFSKEGKLIPAVLVRFVSSSSCAGDPILEIKNYNKNDEITARIKTNEDSKSAVVDSEKKVELIQEAILEEISAANTSGERKADSNVKGRLSISSYSNISNLPRSIDYQRWRYLLSMNVENLANSNISFSNYITFAYRADQWERVKGNLGNALRVYDFAFRYDINKSSSVTLGRKNNSKISNIGSIDGVQFETNLKELDLGFVMGSRPNFSDYGYNAKLFEAGVYISKTDTSKNGMMLNTLAFFEQTNNFNTDRRFIYFQHNNNIIKNINLFISSEVDLYKKINGVSENTFSLTSLFISTRYQPSRIINFSLSYDARKNVIYYETYKNYAESILESETRQGFRFRTTIRPVNKLSLGLNLGYRFKKSDLKPTRNFGGYINYSSIPIITSSVSLTVE